VEVNLILRQRRRSAQFKVALEAAKDTKTLSELVYFTIFRMTRQAEAANGEEIDIGRDLWYHRHTN